MFAHTVCLGALVVAIMEAFVETLWKRWDDLDTLQDVLWQIINVLLFWEGWALLLVLNMLQIF